MRNKKIKVAVGFATGRKTFKKILRCYVENWQDCGLFERSDLEINVIVAYDTKYKNTQSNNFTRISKDLRKLIHNFYFIGEEEVTSIKEKLILEEVLKYSEVEDILGKGYSSLRNTILYKALDEKMDYLLFFDDDEFPISVLKNKNNSIFWSGQNALSAHLSNILNSDITFGYHCGYISPIPKIDFNQDLNENDFALFIKAISNDIVNWESIKATMEDDGVSYAQDFMKKELKVKEVKESNKSKFISGSNLCINLTRPERTMPFFNPPGARGEDTFLGTYLSDRKVLKIPVYAFHDGFDKYNHILDGVVPTKLLAIEVQDKKVVDRFYNACIGWIRYKPLFVYITNYDNYEETILEIKENLTLTIPKICNYFNDNRFKNIMRELKKYDKKVKEHYDHYLNAKTSWLLIIDYILKQKEEDNGV